MPHINGNAVFYVLIVVLLFALLSFAMTTNRSNIEIISQKEQSRLQANEMIEYGSSLRDIIEKMILLGRASDTNAGGKGILFSSPDADPAYGVPNVQPATEIFNAAGGKAFYQKPSPELCKTPGCVYEFTGQYTVTGVLNDAKSELSMIVADINPIVCQMVNDLLSHGWATIPTGPVLTAVTRFDGLNYGDLGGANPLTLTGASNEFVGKRTLCYQEDAGLGRYIFLYVLRSR